jgi:serine/threonine-protein kinase HipA
VILRRDGRSKAARTTTPVTMAQLLLHTPDAAEPRAIGWLSEVGDNLRVSFAADYISDPARPTLSQQYRGADDAATRAILTDKADSRIVRIQRLPTYFENLLPEGRNRERLAERRGVDPADELELLAAAGHDLSGALEVVPARDVPAEVLELHATRSLEPVEAWTVAAAVDNGFSIDGMVPKFSMVQDGRHYAVRTGTEAGQIIAKLPTAEHPDLVFNEATCYRLAEAVGIKTAGATIESISRLKLKLLPEIKEFLNVPRFDRRVLADGSVKRVHFEELAQALGIESRRKYRDLPAAMQALLFILKSSDASSVYELDEVFRRWTAYALMGNTDAHTKNWGLLYADGVNPSLAPAYDMVCVAAYLEPDDPNALAYNRALDKSLRAWDEDQAEQLAKGAGLLNFARCRRVVRETRARAAATWPALLKEAPSSVAKTITARVAELAPASAQRTR